MLVDICGRLYWTQYVAAQWGQIFYEIELQFLYYCCFSNAIFKRFWSHCIVSSYHVQWTSYVLTSSHSQKQNICKQTSQHSSGFDENN